MADAEITQTGLARAAARFPEAETKFRALALADPSFREICEEYALAQESLERIEAWPDAAERPEVGEYRTLIAELEGEIARFLERAGLIG